MAPTPVSRRQLLLAGVGGLVLAACGDGGDDGAAPATSSTTAAPEIAGGLALRRVFSPRQPVGVEVRLPLAVGSAEGHFDVDLPASLAVAVAPAGRTTPPRTVEVARHDQGIPTPYFPLRTSFDEAGPWHLSVTVDDVRLRTTIEAVEPGQLPAVPGPGDALPRLPTPTSVEGRGVDPICTRQPPCPLHERSLDEAVAAGGPVVLLVSTPAFCQTAICGPVLDLLVDRHTDLQAAGASVIHAEVYVDERARQTTPIVQALGLTYEPSLFVAGPGGEVVERLDYTFDAVELGTALDRVTG